MNFSIEDCPQYTDERGSLTQLITNSFLSKQSIPFGQVYFLDFIKKGTVRGNHFHNLSSEVFCLIYGSVTVTLEDIVTKERATIELRVTNGKIQRLIIGNKIAHSIISESDYAMMVCYSSAEYIKDEEDKHFYQLI